MKIFSDFLVVKIVLHNTCNMYYAKLFLLSLLEGYFTIKKINRYFLIRVKSILNIKWSNNENQIEVKYPIYAKLLVRLCDIVAPPVLIFVYKFEKKTNLSGYTWDIINSCVLLISSLIRRVMIKNNKHIRFQAFV